MSPDRSPANANATATAPAPWHGARGRTPRRHRRLPGGATPVLGLDAAATALAGCATTVDVVPGVDAQNPVCARVVRATPDTLAGLERRTAGAQAAAAWGTPAVTVRCGVEVPGPTTDRCLSVELPDGTTVDWINPEAAGEALEDGTAGEWTFITYGRDPAVEVVVPADTGIEQPTGVLVELANAVQLVEPTRHCVGATDVPLPAG